MNSSPSTSTVPTSRSRTPTPRPPCRRSSTMASSTPTGWTGSEERTPTEESPLPQWEMVTAPNPLLAQSGTTAELEAVEDWTPTASRSTITSRIAGLNPDWFDLKRGKGWISWFAVWTPVAVAAVILMPSGDQGTPVPVTTPSPAVSTSSPTPTYSPTHHTVPHYTRPPRPTEHPSSTRPSPTPSPTHRKPTKKPKPTPTRTKTAEPTPTVTVPTPTDT